MDGKPALAAQPPPLELQVRLARIEPSLEATLVSQPGHKRPVAQARPWTRLRQSETAVLLHPTISAPAAAVSSRRPAGSSAEGL